MIDAGDTAAAAAMVMGWFALGARKR